MRLRDRCLAVAICGALQACGSSSNDSGAPPPPPAGATIGLDARPVNTTCVAPSNTAVGSATVELQRVFPALVFDQPLALLQAPGDASRWFVLEKGSGASGTARVRVFANVPNV